MKRPITNPLALSPALLAELEEAAEAQHRSVADVVREMVEQGLSERRWRAHTEKECQRARALGIHHGADERPMTDDDRQTIHEKIAQGLQSLRDGKGTDGEAFLAQMDAELAELERQGR